MKQSKTKIIQVAVFAPLATCFDYLVPATLTSQPIEPGMRVKVPFGKGERETVAIVVAIDVSSKFAVNELKQIIEILDDKPLFSPTLWKLLLWLQQYYHQPLGEVFAVALPNLIEKGRTIAAEALITNEITINPGKDLNPQQQQAVNVIIEKINDFQVYLLQGITGSGKTEVYLEVIAKVVASKCSALVLVPEIGLTPQTIQRFCERFGADNVLAYHSRLTPKKRYDIWTDIYRGNNKIVIGTRSATFLPFSNLGVIVLDEEHDSSFKQQEGVRYHARDVAIVRSKLEQIPIILGSATPSLETLHNVNVGKYQLLELTEKAVATVAPTYKILDISHKKLTHGLSSQLIATTKEHLARGEQVLMFLNRRGFAPLIMCLDCSWQFYCDHCHVHVTYHQRENLLRCHHCLATYKLPTTCPDCHSSLIKAVGVGTEKVDDCLQELFPDFTVLRIDKDTTRKKDAFENILAEVNNNQAALLVGTQMLAKGHDFPNLTLVAVLNADQGFFSSDFRAIERLGQLITQVAGRAGRGNKPGTILIQTTQAKNPKLQQLLHQGYGGLSQTLLQERQQIGLPPFSHLALVRATAKKMPTVINFLEKLKQQLIKQKYKVEILGPVPSPIEFLHGKYRAQLLLQHQSRTALQQAIAAASEQLNYNKNFQVKWSIDVDPIDCF